MLKGDLTSTPLAPLLLELAQDAATGCLHISDTAGEEALVYLKAGLIYSVSVPGSRAQLGAKLVSSGALAPDALAEALEAQRTELQGWRLGELLVHLGYVDEAVVEAFVKEQVNEALWDLLRWPDGVWKFRKNVTARDDVGPPTVVVELLETLRARGYQWEAISEVVHGPAAVPTLATVGAPNVETTLDNDAWSMLCKIDGERSVADLAADCGYTLFEAGHIIVSLVRAGLVEIDENVDIDIDDIADAAGEELYGASTLMSALAGDLEDIEDTPVEPELGQVAIAPAQRPGAAYENPTIVHRYPQPTESFATSIARVSSALSDVLGETPAAETDQVSHRVAPRRPEPAATDDADWDRRKRQRTAAAAELASAQALIETLRAEQADGPAKEFMSGVPQLQSRPAEPEPVPVDDPAQPPEEAARNDAEAAARSAAEQFAKAAADEAERHAAAQAAQQAAEDQAAQAAAEAEAEAAAAAERAEREAAEIEAWDDYAQRVAAEREAAEAAAAAEAERAAAEEAARLAAEAAEAERLAAEEAERLAAEAAEAERLAAEETARLAAEEAAAQAVAELAQRQAEEAARLAAEAAEAERLAAAEAQRIAAEEAAAQAAAEEAQRAAAEESRLATEAAERHAAEAEAERVAAEEAERQAAEATERQAVVAAAAEAAARAADDAAAELAAAEEAALHADEAAAASALLVELANEAVAHPDGATQSPPEDETSDSDIGEVVHEDGDAGPETNDVDRDAGSLASWRDPETTDTAALLRELSSLGGDDDRDSSGSAPRPARPAATDKKVKKKIGLFGL